MKKITVIVVDDHKLIVEMYAQLFLNNENIEMVGESGTQDEAIEMIKIKRPDIVLLDINLAKGSGFDVVPLIREFSPDTRIIAVSLHNRLDYAKKMLQSGAKAYVTKNSSHSEIFKAIEEVMNGGVYVCAEIKDALADQLLCNESQPGLTFRELEIINLIKDGNTSKDIAVQRNISVKTVEVHRYNIFKKLKIKNTASLINFINTTDLIFNDRRTKQFIDV